MHSVSFYGRMGKRRTNERNIRALPIEADSISEAFVREADSNSGKSETTEENYDAVLAAKFSSQIGVE